MAKQNEINYLQLLGSAGEFHALNKPFSDPLCGRYLTDLGQVFNLLPSPPARILDLGVGSGWTSIFLAKRGYEVIGQDIAPDMIELANQNKINYQATSVNFIVQDYEGMEFNNEFDCAFFYDCLHHAESELLALQKTFDALKPGGICITVEPGEGHSTAPGSIAAMQQWGVNEKDMPPSHIIHLAKKIGYRGYKLYRRTMEPSLIYSSQNMSIPQSGASRFLIAYRLVKSSIRCLLKGVYPSDLVLYNLEPAADFRFGNIVVLIK